jgi:hypothetical protein
MQWMTRAVLTALAAGFMIWHAQAAEPLKLQLPVKCEIGRDCFVQQYVDVDPGSDYKDYTCGKQSYDGHKGTDIRLRSTADVARNVAVLAAADGVVKGVRDGMEDVLVRSTSTPESIKDRECGNGVVIEHSSGWETQYCHMKQGSVRVKKGNAVRAGDVLGAVGYSGLAGFAHIHMGVRKDGEVVDPFKGLNADSKACGVGSEPLWEASLMDALKYRDGQVLDVGFAAGKVTQNGLATGKVQGFVPKPQSPALVAWGWAINLQKGDRVVAVLKGPKDVIHRNSVTLEKRKAHYMLFAGKKRKGERWPSGRYTAFFGVVRGGEPILRAARPFDMP